MLSSFGFVLHRFGFVLRVERFRVGVQRLVLRVNGGSVRFERRQVRPKLFEIHLVIGGAERRVVKLVEFLYQLRMRGLQLLLIGRKLIRI